jgi:WD40 repeat protein
MRVEHKKFATPVYAISCSPDGKMLFAVSEAGKGKLISVATGNELYAFNAQGGSFCAAFSPDGKYVIGGTTAQFIQMWDVATGKHVRQFDRHTEIVRAVAFSRDGRFIFSGADDKTVRLWDVSSGRLLKTLEGHMDKVRGVAFTFDGRFSISCSADNTLKLWRLWDDGNTPTTTGSPPPRSFSVVNMLDTFGIELRCTDKIEVSNVRPDSRAHRSALKEGDTITHINGVEMKSGDQVRQFLVQTTGAMATRIQIVREGKSLTLDVR